MTPKEYEVVARQILLERPLKPHQAQDLLLSIGIVHRKGVVTSLDEYYLSMVGLPKGGQLVKIKPAPKKLEQGSLW